MGMNTKLIIGVNKVMTTRNVKTVQKNSEMGDNDYKISIIIIYLISILVWISWIVKEDSEPSSASW